MRKAVEIATVVLIAGLSTPALAQSASPSSLVKTEDRAVEEVIVTASRRGLRVGDIPLSISALSPDTLVTRGIRDSADIAYVAPGLSVISDNAGTESISVRGIVALGTVATTAFYIDETPISQSSGGYFTPRYFDIQRVEVLRGPQGTLFGARAMGGAIRVITKRPNLNRFEGVARGEGSTTNLAAGNYVFDGAFNAPIINDKLALRVTGFYEKQSGWANSFSPIFSDVPEDYATVDGDLGVAYKGFSGTGKRVGDQTIYGARAALLFQPNDGVKVTGTYHWQERENDGYSNSDGSVGLGLGFGQSTESSDFRQARSFAEFRNLRSQLANLTGEFDVGFAKLTSATSYEWNDELRQNDTSALLVGRVVGALGVLPRDTAGRAGVAIISDQEKTSLTQEVRLVSSGEGPFSWIIGGYYNRLKFDQLQDIPVRGLTDILAGSPFDGLAPNDSFAKTSIADDLTEFSVFGEAGYKFTETLSATFGLRRYDIKTASVSGFSGLGAGGDAPPIDISSKEDGFTYKAVLNYKPNRDLLVFAGFTTGYRPGGPNLPPIAGDVIPAGFKSDKLAQYEVGWKSSWFDRALTVNGAVFYIDWSDIPTQVVAPSGVDFTINGPQARNYGAEIEAVIRPIRGLEVSLGLTVLDAKFSEDYVDPSGTGLRIFKDQKLPNVPEVTFNAGVNYEWSLGGDRNARVGANVVHVSKRSQTANEVVSPLLGFTNTGLSAGVEFDKFDVSVFVRNVFDTRALVGNTQVGNEVAGGVLGSVNYQSYVQPRTFGASVQVKF